MDKKICLDTDFLINILRGKKEEIDFLKKAEETCDVATTYVNIFELYNGAFRSKFKENIELVRKFAENIKILDFSHDSVKLAGELQAKLHKQGKVLDMRDLFIGTIAKVNGFSIATGNIRHFERIEDLKIINVSVKSQ